MQEFTLGLDIGTSSCKGTLVSLNGEIQACGQAGYAYESPASGWAEQDPGTWMQAVRDVCALLGKNNRLKGIKSIGVTGQMRGVTFLDKDGAPVRKSILWNDSRCTSELAEAKAKAGDLLRTVTVNPLNTMASLPKLMWVMANEPDVWGKTDKVVFPKDFVVNALTGAIQTDPSDASGSSLFDLQNGQWSTEILDMFGIDHGKLPAVRPSTDIAGGLTNEMADALGMSAGTPVIVGGSDAVMDTYAAIFDTRDALKIRLGTSGAISWLVDSPAAITSPNVYCWNYALPGLYLADINTRSCAQSIDWLRSIAYSECTSPAEAYLTMAGEAAGVAPGAEGVVFRPHLHGEDAPFWDVTLTASFTGLTAQHGRAHLARAVFEGTAFALADAFSVAGVNKPSHATLVGGGTRIPIWTEIVRDVFGCPTRTNPNHDTAFGVAVMAGRASNLMTMTNGFETSSTLDMPDMERHSRYVELFQVYRSRMVTRNPGGDRN